MAGEFKVALTKGAERDFDRIIHYLMTNYSYESARAATAAIKEKVNSLSRYPEANPPWQKDPTSSEVIYRYVIAKKIHRIIFSVMVEHQQVIVVKIVNAKMSKTRILQEIEEE